MTNTTTPKIKDLAEKNWHIVDAKDKVLGKVATEIVKFLLGKHKAIYAPHAELSDKVVVINARDIVVTGNKRDDKLYHRHTGFPGGLRTESFASLSTRRPGEVIRKAVSGMLPKNKLRKIRISNLHVYEGATHPHEAQIK